MLTKEWSIYDHDEGYEKRMQDVKLKNGDILYCCWPNAGVWNVLNKKNNPKYWGREVPCDQTLETRLTHDKDNEGV